AFYFDTTGNDDVMDILIKNFFLSVRKFQKFLIYHIKLGLGKLVPYIFCPVGQCGPTTSCGKDNGGFVYPNVCGIYYFIGLPIFYYSVLMYPGAMGKCIGTHYGFVGLYVHSHFLGNHLAGVIE